jgi:hypothetical protein
VRAAFLAALGLYALVMVQAGIRHTVADPYLSIPRYALGKDGWVCLDRNPRQVHRRDCLPRQK